jgi:hypothetical protein
MDIEGAVSRHLEASTCRTLWILLPESCQVRHSNTRMSKDGEKRASKVGRCQTRADEAVAHWLTTCIKVSEALPNNCGLAYKSSAGDDMVLRQALHN